MDETPSNTLVYFQDIVAATQKKQGFPASDPLTGALLKALATSKPGGTLWKLEPGLGWEPLGSWMAWMDMPVLSR